MSFTLTYRDLANPNFVQGVRKLCQSDKFKDIKQCYNLARIGELLDQEMVRFKETRQKLTKKFQGHKAENEKEPTAEDLKVLEAMKAETEKFLEISFTLERHKLSFEELSELDLTPNEVLSLVPLIKDLPDEEKKPDIQIVKDFPVK